MRKLLTLMLCSILFSQFAIAQAKTITGKVVDENGDAISGASVMIKGTKTGTASDALG